MYLLLHSSHFESFKIYIQSISSIYLCSVAKSYLTLCNPMNCSLPSVHEVFQAKILEWVAISSFRGSFWPRDWTHVSCVSCTGSWIFFFHWATWEASVYLLLSISTATDLSQAAIISHLENYKSVLIDFSASIVVLHILALIIY